MSTITLTRDTFTEDITLGQITHEGEVLCETLELPWRDNARNASCIPAGTYRIELIEGTVKFPYPCFVVHDVPGRSGIMIHRGNTKKDTSGCILVGCGRNDKSVTSSTKALQSLVDFNPKTLIVK